MGHAFRQLKVWEKSIDLTVLVYEFTHSFPRAETYGLISQMRGRQSQLRAISPKVPAEEHDATFASSSSSRMAATVNFKHNSSSLTGFDQPAIRIARSSSPFLTKSAKC